MGFWEFLNWMTDKLKQSVRLITKVCRGLYDLLCAEFSKIYDGAEKMKGYCPHSQIALNAAAYVGEGVITDLLRDIRGGPKILRFAQYGLHSLVGRMRPGHDTDETEESQKFNKNQEEEKISELIERIEKLEKDNESSNELKNLLSELTKRIEKLEEDNKSPSEQNN